MMFQLFDRLDDATEAALVSSIRRHGVLVPVFVDGEGRILDGHQRARIADSIGVNYETITVNIADDEHGREIALHFGQMVVLVRTEYLKYAARTWMKIHPASVKQGGVTGDNPTRGVVVPLIELARLVYECRPFK